MLRLNISVLNFLPSIFIGNTTLAAAVAAYEEKDFLAENIKKTNESKKKLYSVL